jgi:PAS domain S-box-containing protein
MAEQIQEVFWLTSADRQELLYVSPTFETIWGRSRESLYTYPGGHLNLIVDSIHQSDRERVVAALTQQLQKEYKQEYRIVRPDGSIRWVRSRSFLVQNPFGETWSIAGLSEDITLAKESEELLHQREQEFRAIVEHSPDPICRLDRELRYLYVNPAVEAATGIPSQEFLGKTIDELGMPQAIVSLWGQSSQKVFQTGQEDENEFSFFTPNGPKYYQSRVVPELAADGSIESILVISRDITKNKQTEEALRESQERFRAVFEFAPIGIAIANLKGMLLQTNQAFQELLGYTREELQNLSFIEFTHPDDRAENLKLFQELLAGQRTHFSLEKRYFRKDGHIVWSNVSVSAVCDANDLPQYVFAMIQDISAQKQAQLALQKAHNELEKRVAERTAELTQLNKLLNQEIAERQQAQKALQAQKEFLQTVIDAHPNAIVVKNTEGKYVLANQAFADIFGITVEDCFGKTVADFHFVQAEVEQYQREDQDVLNSLQELAISEKAVTTPTGKVRYFQAIKKSLLSPDGQTPLLLGVGTDITELKETQEARRESEQRYRLLIEGMNEGVMIINQNGLISYVNEKLGEMLEYLPSEIIGHLIWDFVDEANLKLVQEQRTKRRRGESGSYELGLKKKDGKKLLIIASETPILATDGSFKGSFAVITDITAFKAVESQLQQAKEQLQAVLDAVPGFVSWISSEGRYLGVNRHLADSFKLPPDAFVGKELGFLKKSPEFVQFMAQFLESSAQTDRQVIKAQINDSTRNYLIAAQKYNQGTNAVSVGIDLTESIQAQEALKAQKEFLQTVLDTNPNLIWVKDREDRIVLANQALADFFGLTVEDMLGLTNYDLHSNATDAEHCIAQDQEVITTLQQKFIPEEAFPNATGEMRWFQTIKKPIFSSNGQVCQILGVSTDITERKLLTEELKAQKEFLQTILDTNPNKIFVKDTEGKYVLVNQACANFLGITVEDMLGHTDTELKVNQADAEEFIAHDQEVLTTLKPQFFPEVACHTSTGELRWFQTIKKPLFSSDGQVRQVFGVCTDITDRKLAQEALRLSEARFRLALDNIPDVFVIYDAQRRIQFVNAQGLRTGGKSLEEHFNHTDEEIWPDEVTKYYLPILKRAVETRTTQSGECNITLPYTSTFTMIVSYVPLLNEQGEIYQILGITHDITKRKLAEEKLRQSEAQLRLALDAARMGFWDWNLQTGLVTRSPSLERLYGWPLNSVDAHHETFLAIVHPQDRDRIHSNTQHAIETGEEYDIEFRIICPDGSIRWIESKGQVFYDETGKAVCMTGINLDISDRKLAETQIKESLREKEVLLQEIHHRVKNNLQVISSLLDLQSQHINEQAPQEAFRESCNRVKSMALVHEQLYQSKDCAKINFTEYIQNLTSYLLRVYDGVNVSQITLELDIDEVTLNINTAIPCGLIISELVSNALKYAFPNSTPGIINVALHSDGNKDFTLIVADNGIGFPIDWDFTTVTSLGLQLVNVLTGQLDGILELDRSLGTQFRISFSEPAY